MTPDEYLKHWETGKIWEHNSRPHHARRFAFVASHLEGERFLDCGCAFGHSTARLAELHPGNWEGMDFSLQGIVRARELYPAFPFHYAEDFGAIVNWGKFDSVVCSEVLEHVENDLVFLRMLMMITKKALLITTPCQAVDDPGHIRVYTKASLAKLFEGYAFEITEEKPFFYAVVKHA